MANDYGTRVVDKFGNTAADLYWSGGARTDNGGGGGQTYYTVQNGDSPASIAGKMYGDQRMFAEIMAANNGAPLRPGMRIYIPQKINNPFVSNELAAAVGMATSGQLTTLGNNNGNMFTPQQSQDNQAWASAHARGQAGNLEYGNLPSNWVGPTGTGQRAITSQTQSPTYVPTGRTAAPNLYGRDAANAWLAKQNPVNTNVPSDTSVLQKFRTADAASSIPNRTLSASQVISPPPSSVSIPKQVGGGQQLLDFVNNLRNIASGRFNLQDFTNIGRGPSSASPFTGNPSRVISQKQNSGVSIGNQSTRPGGYPLGSSTAQFQFMNSALGTPASNPTWNSEFPMIIGNPNAFEGTSSNQQPASGTTVSPTPAIAPTGVAAPQTQSEGDQAFLDSGGRFTAADYAASWGGLDWMAIRAGLNVTPPWAYPYWGQLGSDPYKPDGGNGGGYGEGGGYGSGYGSGSGAYGLLNLKISTG
jgi:hypothetical protein